MQSAEHNKQENGALALSKTFDHKENNGSSPVAQRLRSARGLRGLGRARAARDAPLLQREELADDTRATPLDRLAALAAAPPTALRLDEAPSARRAPPAHALASICAQPPREIVVERLDDVSKLSERAARLRNRVLALGGDPDEDAYASATAKKRGRILVGAAAYVPPYRPPMAGGKWRERWPTDSREVVFLRTNDQLKDMIKRLDTDGLDLSEAVANEIGEIYFENRAVLAPIVNGKKICNPMREAALTKASLHRLVEKVLNYVQYHPKRKGAEPAHGAAMWKLWKVLEKAGVTLSGNVEGVLAPFGVAGKFSDGHLSDETHVLSKASSVVCKCWIVTAARAKLDEKVAQCIGCTFGDGTAEAHEVDGLSDMAAGNFAGAKRDGVPLRRAYAEPQRARAAYVDLLDSGPVRTGTKIVVGMLGAAVVGDAVRRGVVDKTLIIADVGGIDFAKVRPTDFCTQSKKRCMILAEDWDEKDRLFAELHPAIYKIHGLLAAHGLRRALAGGKPTLKRTARGASKYESAYDIVSPTFSAVNALPDGASPLIKTMRVALISEQKFFGHSATLEAFHAYDPAWPITQRLEAEIGCKVTELTAAAFDADDLAKVGGGRRWETKTVPKKRTMKDESGERVKKKRSDEGKKPATCAGCGHPFLSKSKTFVKGFIRCSRCHQWEAKYD